jgi:hypothetical protein
MPPLDSSNLASYDYDADSRVLSITFVSGRTYRYKDVPQDVADGLGSADSPGRYFNSSIKNVYAEG